MDFMNNRPRNLLCDALEQGNVDYVRNNYTYYLFM